METPVPSSAKDTLRAIKILFYAIAAGLVMFALIVFGLSFFQKPPLTNKVISRIFIVAVLFLVIICFLVGSRLYKKKMVAAQSPALALKDKLDIYRSALTSYLAFYEGAGLFTVIGFFLTGSTELLAFVVIIVAAMFQKQPEKLRIFNELQLSSAEQSELN